MHRIPTCQRSCRMTMWRATGLCWGASRRVSRTWRNTFGCSATSAFLFSVVHNARNPAPFEGLYRAVGILQVVLDQEDLHSVHGISTHGSSPPLTSRSTEMEVFRGWIPTILHHRKQKSRRGGTPEGIRPRRLTLQRAPRQSRVALHLVIRQLRWRVAIKCIATPPALLLYAATERRQ